LLAIAGRWRTRWGAGSRNAVKKTLDFGLHPHRKHQTDIHFQERVMRKGLQVLKKLVKDEEGAALIEYTVLLGILLVAVIATIVLVGAWVNTKWTALQANLS